MSEDNYDILDADLVYLRGMLEQTYGEEINPASTDTVVSMFGASFNANAGGNNTNETMDPYRGNPGTYQTHQHADLAFSSYWYGAAAGDAVPLSDLFLQACGFAVSPNDDDPAAPFRLYNPIQRGMKSAGFWYQGRDKLHKLRGARGGLVFSGEIGKAAKIQATFKALKTANPTAITDFPLVPAPVDPCDLSEENAGLLVAGKALDMRMFTLEMGHEIAPVFTSNRSEIVQKGRVPVLKVTVLEPPLAYMDLHAMRRKNCKDPSAAAEVSITIPGWEAFAPKAQLTDLSEGGEYEGAATLELTFALRRVLGNDEIQLKSVGGGE